MIYDDLGRPVDWKILEANPAYETQSGLKDVVGKLASEVMPGTEPYWIEAFGRVAETGEPELIEKWHQPTGRWIHSSTARVGGSGSRRLVSVFYDITERKRNETALRESEARLAAAFESVPADLAVLDLDGLAVIANGEFRRFLPTGVIPSRDPEHMGRWRTWDDAGRLLDPQDWPSARALRGDSVVPGQEMLYTDDDGREIWTNVATAPTYDSEGRVTGVVSVISDIDARKRSEEALRDSERQAQTLLAELQHRVRNILAIVRSMIARAAVGKTDLPDFVDHLQGRISAMARTQSILTRKPGQDVDLEQILRDEMLSDATRDDKLRLKGPPVFLSPKAAEVLTLAIHELSTNSLKYGALADGGSVRVSWKIDRVEKEDWLDLIWAESGVAIDDLEPAPGFGTELITIRVPYELGGTSVMTFTPDGLAARIRFPLRPGTSLLQTGAGSISEEASK